MSEGDAGSFREEGGDPSTDGAAARAGEQITIENAFAEYDRDKSGFIDASELRGLLQSLGAKLSGRELKQALRILDEDGSGMIELDEFKRWWENKDASAGTGDDLELRRKLERVAATGRQHHRADIHVAAWRGETQLMRQFLDVDAALVNAPDETEIGERFTPLHYAAYQGHLDMCSLLLDGGADVNATTDSGCTPLFHASQQLHAPIVHLLLKRGADPTLCDSRYHLSPLDVCPPSMWPVFKEHGCSAPDAPGKPTVRMKGTEALVSWEYAYPARPGRQAADGRWHVPGSTFQVVIRVLPDGEKAAPVDWGRLKTFYGTTQALVDGLEPGARYSFSVRAVSPLGKSQEGPPSDPAALKTLAPPPSAPEPIIVGDTYIDLQWSPPVGLDRDGVAGFAVRFRPLNEHGIPTGPSRRVAAGEGCSYKLSRLEPGQAYRVSVAAVTKAGVGLSSEAVVVRTELTPSAANRRLRHAQVKPARSTASGDLWAAKRGQEKEGGRPPSPVRVPHVGTAPKGRSRYGDAPTGSGEEDVFDAEP